MTWHLRYFSSELLTQVLANLIFPDSRTWNWYFLYIVESHELRTQSCTSLKVDLCLDIKQRFFYFNKYFNGTFSWRKCSFKGLKLCWFRREDLCLLLFCFGFTNVLTEQFHQGNIPSMALLNVYVLTDICPQWS